MASDNSPKKDVVYVDIDDDITSIIDKVKTSKSAIVALVPPKRIGALQSVVNLKLLQRAANGVDKHVVLITSDASLVGLAAGAAIPVAKNLQSKPEMPPAHEADSDSDDVIDGDDMSLADLAAGAVIGAGAAAATATKSKAGAKQTKSTGSGAAKPSKKGTKLPDFDGFRKKLFFGITGGVLLVLFLIWAIIIAPHATVAITAQTTLININQTLQLQPNATANPAQNLMPATTKQTKKTASVDFDATGKKEVGDKATGTVKFSTNNISNLGMVVPSGTVLSAPDGTQFVTNEDITITISNYQGAPVGVTAVTSGTSSNGAVGALTGAPSGITATLSGTTSGGTDKTVTVVSQADVDKAKQQLQTQDAEAVKKELKGQFGSDMIVIDESYKAEAGEPTSTPAVGQEATKAKLTAETTYTLVGIERSDLKANFDAYLKTQLSGKQNQKVYDSGENSATFSQFTTVEGGYTTKVTSQAQVGPLLDEAKLKPQLVGLRAGEIQQQIEAVEGVEDVQVSFSPFWVNKAPSADKITIEFVLKNGTN